MSMETAAQCGHSVLYRRRAFSGSAGLFRRQLIESKLISIYVGLPLAKFNSRYHLPKNRPQKRPLNAPLTWIERRVRLLHLAGGHSVFPASPIRNVCFERIFQYREQRHLVSPQSEAELKASDVALMERIMQRDETALAALYDRYAGILSSVLNRILRDKQAAEEILQDIFFQLWRGAQQFDASRGSVPGWLMVIARNRAISRLRHHNPAQGEELRENTVCVGVSLESSIAQRQLMEKVQAALDTLPKEQRAAVELAYFEGLTQSEIAARTGDPLGTVKTRLRTALGTLKRALHP